MRFIDAREDLPRHATKRFSQRSADDIVGGCVHHTAGGDDVYNTARYHVGPNHVSESGCPGLLYTFYITGSGTIYWANDLESVVWSQGGHGSPVLRTNANTNFISICCAGDYSKGEYKGRNIGPPYIQVMALLTLWGHLTGSVKSRLLPLHLYDVLSCNDFDLWGHHNFGKDKCPGLVLESLVDSIRSYRRSSQILVTALDWQSALNRVLSSDLILDGIWGSLSKAALVEFQMGHGGLVVDGIRGPLSEAALLESVGEQHERNTNK
tara:strand:- start:5408 stop:6205 length:798 start_codon:yes stop_codon:yes gene_type:complete